MSIGQRWPEAEMPIPAPVVSFSAIFLLLLIFLSDGHFEYFFTFS